MISKNTYKFFTDNSVKNDYLLIQLKDFSKINTNNWKEIFIDPSVNELKINNEYSWISNFNIVNFLENLPNNCFFSVDYPNDMLDSRKIINFREKAILTNKFILKSYENASKYCYNKHYICTIQFKLNDFSNFKFWFNKYNDLNINSEILGLGNLCRVLYLNDKVKQILKYAFKNSKHKRIHIYGLGLRLIPYTIKKALKYNIMLSFDNTKWTRACSTTLRNKYYPKINCVKANRQEFFNEYIKIIEKRIK